MDASVAQCAQVAGLKACVPCVRRIFLKSPKVMYLGAFFSGADWAVVGRGGKGWCYSAGMAGSVRDPPENVRDSVQPRQVMVAVPRMPALQVVFVFALTGLV